MSGEIEDLIRRLRAQADTEYFFSGDGMLYYEAADAIEELLKAAKAMHTWIFLNSFDEQAAYNECGLTDEMNASLGYGGQYIAEIPEGCE